MKKIIFLFVLVILISCEKLQDNNITGSGICKQCTSTLKGPTPTRVSTKIVCGDELKNLKEGSSYVTIDKKLYTLTVLCH